MFVYMWYSVEILYKGENWEFTVNKGYVVINKVYRKKLVSDSKKIYMNIKAEICEILRIL